jgi:uncharacterized Zn-binding protein involved in type VI secretion
MPPACRVGDLHACPLSSGTVPHVGGPVLPPGATRTLIEGRPAARVGDLAVCAGGPDAIAIGSFTALIEGLPAARLGDTTAHGGQLTLGSATVLVGDTGGGAGSPQSAALAAAAAAGLPFVVDGCAEREAARAIPERPPATGTDWIELEVVDRAGRPVPYRRCRITAPDGAVHHAWSNAEGIARVEGLPSGQCRVELTELDREAWRPA